MEKFIADKDQNKQRAAAELLAGVLGGRTLCTHKGSLSSHVGYSRLEALADEEARDIMGLVHTPYEKDLLAEHQDGHLTDLVIVC